MVNRRALLKLAGAAGAVPVAALFGDAGKAQAQQRAQLAIRVVTPANMSPDWVEPTSIATVEALTEILQEYGSIVAANTPGAWVVVFRIGSSTSRQVGGSGSPRPMHRNTYNITIGIERDGRPVPGAVLQMSDADGLPIPYSAMQQRPGDKTRFVPDDMKYIIDETSDAIKTMVARALGVAPPAVSQNSTPPKGMRPQPK